MQNGQIFKIHSDFHYVNSGNKIYECKLREIIKKQKQKVFVGDYVEFSDGAIEKILPRKNFITRPTVANIDQVLIVSAVKEPDLDYTQLDRYITFAKYHKLKTVLCFNKNDLSRDDKIIENIFSIYEPLGFDILFTSATENYGTEELKKILKNKVTVLCGSSGVGKSSLINAVSGICMRTNEVSKKTGKGTHTTRHCEIIQIDKKTGIVDTPGFSNLKFDFLMPNDLATLFPEINQYKSDCKFPDCIHINETNCAVKANIGNFSQSRYESYVIFAQEAQTYKEKVKYNGTKTETNHKKTNDKVFVKISSKKRESARNTIKQNIYKDVKSERTD